MVASIEDRWQEPDAEYFKVRTADSKTYLFRYERQEDVWTLQSVFDGDELLARPGIDTIKRCARPRTGSAPGCHGPTISKNVWASLNLEQAPPSKGQYPGVGFLCHKLCPGRKGLLTSVAVFRRSVPGVPLWWDSCGPESGSDDSRRGGYGGRDKLVGVGTRREG